MKKKFKKLTLNSETLRNLNTPDFQQVAGGRTFACTETVPCSLCSHCVTVCPCT